MYKKLDEALKDLGLAQLKTHASTEPVNRLVFLD